MSEVVKVAGGAGAENSSLCTACGLCCNGSIFGTVTLQPEDNLERLALLQPEREPEGKVFFRQPCRALRGTCCSIYAERPVVCRHFHCKLLKAVTHDPTALPAAFKTVATTTELLDRLGPQLLAAGFGEAQGPRAAAMNRFRGAMLQATDQKDRDFFQRHGPLVQLWLQASWMIRRHFHEKASDDGATSPGAAAGETSAPEKSDLAR